MLTLGFTAKQISWISDGFASAVMNLRSTARKEGTACSGLAEKTRSWDIREQLIQMEHSSGLEKKKNGMVRHSVRAVLLHFSAQFQQTSRQSWFDCDAVSRGRANPILRDLCVLGKRCWMMGSYDQCPVLHIGHHLLSHIDFGNHDVLHSKRPHLLGVHGIQTSRRCCSCSDVGNVRRLSRGEQSR